MSGEHFGPVVPADQRGQRDTGLDVLRGIALLAVCGFHSGIFLGGWLGVDLFFVISGFWIARKLSTSEQRLRVFAMRRVVRLLPALAVFISVWLIIALAWPGSKLATAWTATNTGEALTPFAVPIISGTGATNWWLIADQPWPDALGHLWSLAVEWQFYLAAPVLVWLLARITSRRVALGGLFLAAGVFAVVNSVGILPEFGQGAAYLSTIGRAPALLIGVAIAVALASFTQAPSRENRSRTAPAAGNPSWFTPVLIAWLVLAVAVPQNGAGVALGIPVAAVLSGLLVWSVARTGVSRLGSILRIPVATLAWLGRRSYSAYLWNLPIVVALSVFLADWEVLPRAALALGLTVGAAVVMWQCIEKPTTSWVRQRTSQQA